MKECDFCGTQNEDWMEICLNCGHKLAPGKPEPKEEEKPKVIRTVNPNGTLMLVLGILIVVFVILLIAVLIKFK